MVPKAFYNDTPIDILFDSHITHNIISFRCAKDDTVVFLPDGPQGTKRFSFGAFAFPTGAATVRYDDFDVLCSSL